MWGARLAASRLGPRRNAAAPRCPPHSSARNLRAYFSRFTALLPATLTTLHRYLTELKFHGGSNLLENAVSVATVIPTPTITKNQDIIYTTGTSKLAINGTTFSMRQGRTD